MRELITKLICTEMYDDNTYYTQGKQHPTWVDEEKLDNPGSKSEYGGFDFDNDKVWEIYDGYARLTYNYCNFRAVEYKKQ